VLPSRKAKPLLLPVEEKTLISLLVWEPFENDARALKNSTLQVLGVKVKAKVKVLVLSEAKGLEKWNS